MKTMSDRGAARLPHKDGPRPWRANLEHVLHNWIGLLDRYTRKHTAELPYWYNERSNVGVLAGAAWISGFTALEEFAEDKAGTDMGRCDLFMGLGDELLYAEAKIEKPVIQKDANGVDAAWDADIARGLTAAREGSRAVRKGAHHIKRVGLLFVVPRIEAKDHEKFADIRTMFLNSVEPRIEKLVASSDLDFWAWYFPPEAEQRPSPTIRSLFPGVLLMGRTHGFKIGE